MQYISISSSGTTNGATLSTRLLPIICALVGVATVLTGCRKYPSGTNSKCVAAVVSSAESADRDYRASIKRLTCEEGSARQYELLLETRKLKQYDAWRFTTRLETDLQFGDAPTIEWSDHSLDVHVPARTISGSLVEHLGPDVVLRITYAPSRPNAFPNFF